MPLEEELSGALHCVEASYSFTRNICKEFGGSVISNLLLTWSLLSLGATVSGPLTVFRCLASPVSVTSVTSCSVVNP